MPLLDKNRSLLDNISDVTEKHRGLIIFAMILKWMTRNKGVVIFVLILIVLLVDTILNLFR